MVDTVPGSYTIFDADGSAVHSGSTGPDSVADLALAAGEWTLQYESSSSEMEAPFVLVTVEDSPYLLIEGDISEVSRYMGVKPITVGFKPESSAACISLPHIILKAPLPDQIRSWQSNT